MYGSCKPNSEAYKVTRIYDFTKEPKDIPIKKFDDKKLSVF